MAATKKLFTQKRPSKKRQTLKYKQWKRKIHQGGYAALNKMSLAYKIPTVAEFRESNLARFITPVANDCGSEVTTKELIINWFHLVFLKSHTEAIKENKPNWNQAMNVLFANEYCQAVCNELENLEDMGDWDVVDTEYYMNVIISTRDFKLQQYPGGLIKNFKDRFCAHGEMQLEGIYSLETYAPDVQWTTICLILILEVL